jgi:hypothetical protein
VAGLVNGRGDGEGRWADWRIGGVVGRGQGTGVRCRRALWQRAPRSEAGTVGGHSIGLSPVNFISWEWADGRYFNFRRHSLRPAKVTYLTSAHISRWKLPILRRLLDKPTKVIVADKKFSFSYSDTAQNISRPRGGSHDWVWQIPQSCEITVLKFLLST